MSFVLIRNKNWFTRYMINELNEHITEYIDVNLLMMLKNCTSNINSRYYVNDKQERNEIQQQPALSVLRLDFVSIFVQRVKNLKLILSNKLATMLWTTVHVRARLNVVRLNQDSSILSTCFNMSVKSSQWKKLSDIRDYLQSSMLHLFIL